MKLVSSFHWVRPGVLTGCPHSKKCAYLRVTSLLSDFPDLIVPKICFFFFQYNIIKQFPPYPLSKPPDIPLFFLFQTQAPFYLYLLLGSYKYIHSKYSLIDWYYNICMYIFRLTIRYWITMIFLSLGKTVFAVLGIPQLPDIICVGLRSCSLSCHLLLYVFLLISLKRKLEFFFTYVNLTIFFTESTDVFFFRQVLS